MGLLLRRPKDTYLPRLLNASIQVIETDTPAIYPIEHDHYNGSSFYMSERIIEIDKKIGQYLSGCSFESYVKNYKTKHRFESPPNRTFTD